MFILLAILELPTRFLPHTFRKGNHTVSYRHNRRREIKEIRKDRALLEYHFNFSDMLSLIIFITGLVMLGFGVINLFLARYDLLSLFIILGVMFICFSVILIKDD